MLQIKTKAKNRISQISSQKTGIIEILEPQQTKLKAFGLEGDRIGPLETATKGFLASKDARRFRSESIS